MNILLKTAPMVVPVITMLLLGCLCNKRQYLDVKGWEGLKAVIGNILLPVVLFQAFLTADYNIRVLLVFVVVYCGFGAAIILGYAVRRWIAPYGRFAPFLVTCAEGGMLGYALFGLIAGSENTYLFATVDLGQTVFAFTIFLSLLKVEDGGKVTVKDILNSVFTNKACIGMMAGIVLGITGIGGWLLGSPAGETLQALMQFITAPTAGVILIVVGYQLSLDRKVLGPVLRTVLCRVLILGTVFLGASLLLFHIIPFDRQLFLALMIMYSLPAPFIIPLFADAGEDSGYIAGTLSVETLVTIVLFTGIAVYSVR